MVGESSGSSALTTVPPTELVKAVQLPVSPSTRAAVRRESEPCAVKPRRPAVWCSSSITACAPLGWVSTGPYGAYQSRPDREVSSTTRACQPGPEKRWVPGRYVDCPAAGDGVERWSTFSSAARGPSIGNRDLLMVDNEREGVQLHALPLTALLRREATPPGRLGDAASVSADSVTSRVLRSQPITESTSALASFWTCAKCSAPLNDSA